MIPLGLAFLGLAAAFCLQQLATAWARVLTRGSRPGIDPARRAPAPGNHHDESGDQFGAGVFTRLGR